MGNNYYIALFAIFGTILGYKYMSSSRGVRNNNPLNIKYSPSNNWVGQTGKETNGPFAVFSSPVYGFRAAMKTLNSYRRRGIDSLEDIITTWAPSHENPNQNKYIQYVSQRTKILPAQRVNKSDYPKLVAAMAKFETGEEWPEAHINNAFNMV